MASFECAFKDDARSVNSSQGQWPKVDVQLASPQ